MMRDHASVSTALLSDALRDWLAANAHVINAIPAGSIVIQWDQYRVSIKGPSRNTVISLGIGPLQTR